MVNRSAARASRARGTVRCCRAIAGAILYYAIIKITSLEIGLAAIAIGYMVGYAIRKATQGRGGRLVQIMAVVLTYWSVGLAYLPLVVEAINGDETVASSPAAADPSTVAPAAPPTTVTAPPTVVTQAEPEGDAGGGNTIVAMAMLFGLTFALPVLTIAGSMPGGLISAAIIGFGMHQAWKITGAPQLAPSPVRFG